MSEIDMSQPVADVKEENKLLSRRKRFLALMKTRKFWKELIGKVFIYTMLIDFALVFIIPILYMIVTGIESPVDLADEDVIWIPKRPLYTENMKWSFAVLDYWNTLWYTVKIVAICTIGHVLSGALVGYAVGRLKFLGRGMIFAFVLISLIVPAQALVTMMIQIYVDLMPSWPDIYRIIIPCFLGCGLNGGIFIFIFRQVYAGLPKELEEAAMIDGCGIFQTFRRIMLPLTSSAILVCAILSIVWHWNDLFEPTKYIMTITSKDTVLMSLRLYHTFLNPTPIFDVTLIENDASNKDIQLQMFSTLLSLAPIFVMYVFVQKYFMASVANTGIKG